MRRAGQADHPFKQQRSHIELVQELQNWWFNPEQNQPIKVLSHPMNQKSTLSAIHFLLTKLTKQKKQLNVLYIVDSKQRQAFIIRYTRSILETFFEHIHVTRLPAITEQHTTSLDVSQIIFCTFKDFVANDLKSMHIYAAMLVETSHFVRSVRDSFSDYITDTYLRRGYIEALRLQEAYREYERPQNAKSSSEVQKKKSAQPQLISLHSKEESVTEKRQPKAEQPAQENSKKIRRAFEKKREQMLQKNAKQEESKFFEENELVLISGIIYIIGFFYNQLQIKKSRNFEEFIWDYQNKTSLSRDFLQNALRYLVQIYDNCPMKVYEKLEDMYLYSLCQFINRIITYCQIFPDDYQELFQITKPDRYPLDRREALIEQSSSCLMINCKENNKICAKVLKQKSLKCMIVQNLACPEEYWHYIFKKNNILVNPQTCSSYYSKLYGLHISKTPSNEDLNFAEKLRADIETIKVKACGVLLHDLSKFTPDGIAVYFYSLEGLENFIKEMDKDDEKILKRIDNNKKIFFQSAFQEENHVNFLKFKKCCEIGRGAIFFMAANGKAAQYLKFYRHLSRCIVFFGLPRKQNEPRKELLQPLENEPPEQKILQQMHTIMQKISIFNECMNNCINTESDYKSVIFVGGQISSDLSTWYKSFIKSWDQTTRESLMKLRNYFQKMGKVIRQ